MDKIERGIIKQYQKNNEIDQVKAKAFLDDMIECLEYVGLLPYLVFGTALGFYRDNKFIPYDIDIDIALFNCPKSDIPIQIIKDKGIQHVRDIRDLHTFSRDMINLDLYFFNLNDGIYECKPDNNHYTIQEDDIKYYTIVRPTASKQWYKIPENPEDYFERLYGKDWRTPIEGRHAQC